MAHAQVATQQQSAKKMSLENKMLEMDINSLKAKGLSPLDHKHTPSNWGLSMLLQKFIQKGQANYQDLKNNPLTINDLTSTIRGILDPPFEGDMQDFSKYKSKAKDLAKQGYKMIWSDKGSKSNPPYYLMQPPYTQNRNLGVKIYYGKNKNK